MGLNFLSKRQIFLASTAGLCVRGVGNTAARHVSISTNKAAVPAGWLSASERTYTHTAHGGQFKCSQCGRTAEGVPSDLDRGRVDDPSVQ